MRKKYREVKKTTLLSTITPKYTWWYVKRGDTLYVGFILDRFYRLFKLIALIIKNNYQVFACYNTALFGKVGDSVLTISSW